MAHTATITVDQLRAERISRNFGMISGTCNVTSYNATARGKLTDITKYFVAVKSVTVDASDSGYIFQWLATSNSFKCFGPTYLGPTSTAGGQTGVFLQLTAGILYASASAVYLGAGKEATSGTDVGEVHFLAIGLLTED